MGKRKTAPEAIPDVNDDSNPDNWDIVDMGYDGLSMHSQAPVTYAPEVWDGNTILVHPKKRKNATITSSAINLLNTIVGAGILSLPFAFAQLGVILGPICIIAVAVLTHITMVMLTSVGLRLLENAAQSAIPLPERSSLSLDLGRRSTSVDTERPSPEGGSPSRTSIEADRSKSPEAVIRTSEDRPRTPSTPEMSAELNTGVSPSLSPSVSPTPYNEKVALPMVTFPWVARRVSRLAVVVLDVGMIFLCLGIAVSYLIVMSDTIISVIHSVVDATDSSSSSFASSVVRLPVLHNRHLWVTIVFVVLAPLCYLKSLNQLRYVSYLNLICVGYLVFLIIYVFFEGLADIDWHAVPLSPGGIGAVNSFSIIVFSFACQVNYYSVFDELGPKNRRSRSHKTSALAIISGLVVYAIFAVLGTMLKGRDVKSNFLTSFPSKSPVILIGRIVTIVNVACGFPLLLHALRTCIESLWAKVPVSQRLSEFANRAISASIPLAIAYVVAMIFHKLDIVLGLTGATGGAITCFILPGLAYWKTFPEKKVKGAMSIVLIVFGFLMLVLGIIVCFI